MVLTASARCCQRYSDFERTLMRAEDAIHSADIMTLVAVPEKNRKSFEEHLCELSDYVSLIHPDLGYPNGWARGLKPFEDFYRGMRIALYAVQKIREMGGKEALIFRDLMKTYDNETDDLTRTLVHTTLLAGGLVGRDTGFPGAHDWRLVAVLRHIPTWPYRFGASMPRHPRSQKKLIALLHKLMPNVVPAHVPPSTIKTIWHPRPRKYGRKLK
jgi:hypothetical protein